MAADSISELLIADTAYPEPLREIHNPPQRLFLRGRLPERIFFAVVGSRAPSPYGKQITPKLVEPLAAAGLVIVSGLAYGIDALAHEAALAQG
ncbi:MAG: DNA-processing protein DprA, partial [Candidatus Terrybacteria bacterium]|nr:DNA-processing protein DprA [Candidatus Terrybacteria bacterium]